MPRSLRGYQNTRDLRFITFSCYRSRPLEPESGWDCAAGENERNYPAQAKSRLGRGTLRSAEE